MKTKLVVVNENTLGYILPELPNYISILHTSILRGSSISGRDSIFINSGDRVRLATKEDFDLYRVDFTGYDNPNEYEYDQAVN